MLKYSLSLVLVLVVTIFAILLYFQLDTSNGGRQDLLMYQQMTPDSLVSLTPYVVGNRLNVVGVLAERWRDEGRSSFTLLSGKSWLDMDFNRASFIGVNLTSTTEEKFPEIFSECIGKFVSVDGIPQQHMGSLSIFMIYSIQLVERGSDSKECLINKPDPSSLVGSG